MHDLQLFRFHLIRRINISRERRLIRISIRCLLKAHLRNNKRKHDDKRGCKTIKYDFDANKDQKV